VTREAPLVLFVIGPPAVGKMTVGEAVAGRTGLRLFHNHQSIELALAFFSFGTAPFERLVRGIRERVFEEVAQSDLPGLVFTYVWAFDQPADACVVEQLAEIFRVRGGRVLFLDLQASQNERLRRNETEFRLAQKPSKRDVVASRRRLLAADARHSFDASGHFGDRKDYLRIDNTALSPEEVADRAINAFQLPLAMPVGSRESVS
jgi:hypothetical protein